MSLDMLLSPYVLASAVLASMAALTRRIIRAERAYRLEEELLSFLAFIYAKQRAGLSTRRALEEASSRKDLLPTFSSEAARMLRLADAEGSLSAGLSRYNAPSRRVREAIRSIGEEESAGFDPAARVEALMLDEEDYLEERGRRRVEAVENLAEATMAVLILLPLYMAFAGLLGGPSWVIAPLAGLTAGLSYVAAAALQGPGSVILSSLPRRLIPAQVGLAAAAILLAILGRPLAVAAIGVALIAISIPAVREVRLALSEAEGSFLLAQSLATRLRMGYDPARAFALVRDGRVEAQVRRLEAGIRTDPRSRVLALILDAVRSVREAGMGAEALAVVAKSAQRAAASMRAVRARLKVYEVLAMAGGAAVLIASYAITRPLVELLERFGEGGGAAEAQGIALAMPFEAPSPEPLLMPLVALGVGLGFAVSKMADQTVATSWRAGVGVVTTALAYAILAPLW